MTKPSTLKIDDVEYIRKDSVPSDSPPLGDKRIIIADRGWIFVGACTDNSDGTVTIRNAKNIRKWGTTKGLGELSNGPIAGKTVADDYGTVKTLPIAQINVVSGW
jgi:hypothetical protein